MRAYIRFVLIAPLLLAASCCGPYRGCDLFGADEFVLDSYKIRQGKYSILEMQGQCFEELDASLLEEDCSGLAAGSIALAGKVGVASAVVDGKTRLFDVLAQAQICSRANLFKSYVARGAKLLAVDLHKLLKEGDMSQNIAMRGGDRIYIADASEAAIAVVGEVGVQKVIGLPSGSMPLSQALAQACGISYTGNGSCIQVIRGAIACPKVYALSWNHVLYLAPDSMLLMPGDIVYVGSKPIAEWHRFISQLLPSLINAETKCCGCSSD